MRTLFILAIIISMANCIVGQTNKNIEHQSLVTIDKNFIDTLTFSLKWDYPWYIIKHEDGHFENTIESENVFDTVHLFHTANCKTNHQGEHSIRYCKATISRDTIKLLFQPESPAYFSMLSVYIFNGKFWSDFSAVYPLMCSSSKLNWISSRQNIILDDSSYVVGDTIKGFINVDFTELNYGTDSEILNQDYFFKGYFKTRIEEN